MNTANGLIILMLNQGDWFGGETGSIALSWATADRAIDVVVTWDLSLGPTSVAGGRAVLPADSDTTRISIMLPEVRTRTQCRWRYRLSAGGSANQPFAFGEHMIHLFPRGLLNESAKLLGNKRVVLWEEQGTLGAVLKEAGIPVGIVASDAALQFIRADMILVGQEQLKSHPFAQEPLMAQARQGSSVMFFQQSHVPELAGYAMNRRAVPDELKWHADHPLLRGFTPADVDSWLRGGSGHLWPLRLPADEPVLVIAQWPRETPGQEPEPIETLLATKSVGAGRVVFCQLPLGSWESDPRSQLMLVNALDYLVGPVAPTPPPSQRHIPLPPTPQTAPSITVPPGARP